MYPLLPFLFFPFPSPNQVEGDAAASMDQHQASAGMHVCPPLLLRHFKT
jgi:hypothetical protein